jgi:glucose-6-phosphate isomerase
VRLPRLDAYHLGELLFLYQAATAFAGELYGIDAFDQPGVEHGKRLAFALLGRTGYEAEAAALAQSSARGASKYRV